VGRGEENPDWLPPDFSLRIRTLRPFLTKRQGIDLSRSMAESSSALGSHVNPTLVLQNLYLSLLE
jgi:hypothetical protein